MAPPPKPGSSGGGRGFSIVTLLFITGAAMALFAFITRDGSDCSCSSDPISWAQARSRFRTSPWWTSQPQEDSTSAGPAKVVLPADSFLELAEASFRKHLQLRQELWNGSLPALEDLSTAAELPNRHQVEERMLVPVYPCATEQRLGNWGKGKGGKWVCLAYRKAAAGSPPVVASIRKGAKEVSFELAAAKVMEATVHLFAPDMADDLESEVQKKEGTVTLHRSFVAEEAAAGKGEQPSDQPPSTWLSNATSQLQVLEQLGLDHVDMLHLDCSLCEDAFIEAVASKPRSDVPAYGQILLRLGPVDDVPRTLRILLRLERMGYRMFHAEKDVFAPKFYEVAFIHESLVAPSPSSKEEAGSPPALKSLSPFPCADQAALQQLLQSSEAAYKRNLRHRAVLLKGVKMPSEEDVKTSPRTFWHLNSQSDFEAAMLVPTYSCALQRRFGLWGEGGKWVCLGFCQQRVPAIVSAGSEGETSFEEAVFDGLHTIPWTIDPLNFYIEGKLKQLKFMTFHGVGLTGASKLAEVQAKHPEVQWLTPPRLLDYIGMEYVDVFKIDCEGCELEVVDDLASTYNRKTVPFGEISMEVHHTWNVTAMLRLMLSLENLGYRLYHAEISAYVPHSCEIALVHEALVAPRLPQAAP